MLTKQQMLNALDGLIVHVARIHSKFLSDLQPWTPDFVSWLTACESTVEAIFGSTSDALQSFKGIYFIPPPGQTYANELEEQKAKLTWYDSGIRYANVTLIGYRYSVEQLAREEPTRSTPFIFVSHGGPTMTHVNTVCEFLDALGLVGIVVSKMPNLNLSINEKVHFFMGLCVGGIALATLEDETLANEQRARPNVENEIGIMQAAPNIAGRIIYLKEPDVQFASNYAEKVWIPFSKDRVQDAFTSIARDLRAFLILP